MTWQDAAHALWGPDWIAPLSDVLNVNRRTVERWRAGEQEIPNLIAADLIRLPRIGTAQSAYGTALRRLARGETVEDLEQSLADDKRALMRLKADLGRYAAIAVLAKRDAKARR